MCYTISRFKLTAKEFLRKKNTKKEITKTMSLNSTPSADRGLTTSENSVNCVSKKPTRF